MSLAGYRRRLWSSVRASPATWSETLPGQRVFREATNAHQHVVVFGANGTGKTYGLCLALLDVLQGRHPRWHRPIDVLLCVTGWHSISARSFTRALHRLAPVGLLGQQDIDDRGRAVGRVRPWYSPQRGFVGAPPRLVVLRGPMIGSQIDLTTLGAGPAHSTGGTYPLVVVDEPITSQEYAELQGRGRGVQGSLWYLFTPTENSPDQGWARALCEQGLAHLVQIELTPESLVLSSGRRIEPWEETATRIARWPASERDMRCGRSWKPLRGNTYFADVWSPDLIRPCERGAQLLILGLDHSTRVGRMRLVLSAFEARDRVLHAHTLVDVRSTTADLEQTASELLDALEKYGLTIDNVDYTIGDRVAVDRQLVRRDNQAFRAALMAVLRRREPRRRVPRGLEMMRQPKKYRGSHLFRQAYMRTMMAEKRWLFDQNCNLLPQDIQTFDGRDAAAEKDGLDAFGYTLELAGSLTGAWLAPVEDTP